MSEKWFRSTVFKGGIDEVTLDKDGEVLDGKIKGVAVVTAGLAVGHNVFLDDKFLDDVSKIGNDKTLGLKARFGHPSMSSDAVGTFAGRFNNFNVVDGIVRADLDLAESSRKAPKGDLKEYILSLAAESPDMFGISIVFTPGKEFQVDADDGEKIFDPGLFDNKQKTFVTIKSLHAADVVDEPAANTGLFSQWSSEMIAGKVADFFDMNPGILDLIENHPEIVEPFMARYHKQKEGITMKEKTEVQKADVTAASDASTEVLGIVKYSERDLFSTMKDRFGLAFAAQAFDEGLSLEQATEKHITNLSSKVEELSTKLETALNALNLTGAEPLSSEAISESEDRENAASDERIKRFAGMFPEGIAKFAAGIKIKN